MSGIFHHLLAFVSAATDPFWKYVTLLLHGDGTNGAQNNTFIDSSSNAFTVTRNGTTTQGSFSPFGPDWSNYFNGSSYLLTTATQVIPSGSFTIQTWVFPTSSADSYAVAQGTTGNAGRFSLGITSTLWFVQIGSASVNAGSVTLNQWTHIAATFNGATLTLYVNGTSVGTASTTTNAQNTTLRIATLGPADWGTYYWTGYISNVRATNTVEFTSTFTPSTTPLTAITGTSVLTCQASRFIDNSANAFAITVNGTPSIQRFSPFSMGSAYSTSVIGGSGYYNGSTDYLSVPYNAKFDFGTGSFTIEAWVYLTTASGARCIVSVFPSGFSGTSAYEFLITTSNFLQFDTFASGTEQLITATNNALVPNSWNHVAVVNNAGTYNLYANGIQCTKTGSITQAVNTNGSAAFTIGYSLYSPYNHPTTGYISNLRVVKGTAVYTAAFTPPTAPLTAITNTSLLLSTINGGIYDNAMINNFITVGAAQVSTTQSKFGGASMSFNGSSSYLQGPTNVGYSFGTGNFTIEFWVYVSSYNAVATTILRTATASGWALKFLAANSNCLVFAANSADVLTDSGSPSTGTWTYFALVRNGSTLTMYRNGTSVASTTYATAINVSDVLLVGAGGDSSNSSFSLNGYIDDVRITKGIARYTANFTAPTAAFPNQ
jgi:hypothetical protein